MFLHLGEGRLVRGKEIIGIFNYDLIQKSRDSKEFIEITTNERGIEKINTTKKIKSFIVTQNKTFLSPISTITLEKRAQDLFSKKENLQISN